MKTLNRKKPLTAALKAECHALKNLFQTKKKELNISQATLAKALGCNQSSVSHYLNGLNALNANAAAIFAQALKVKVSDFSPRLAQEITNIASALNPVEAEISTSNADNIVSLNNWNDQAAVPFLEDIQLAAGVGQYASTEDYSNAEKLHFSKSTLRKVGVYSRNVICVTVRGDSMSPIIPDGTTVGIDIACTTITNGDIYAIAIDNDLLKIKQLYKLPNGNIRLRSFNYEEFADEEFAPQVIRVIGRIFWYSVLL